MNDINKFFSKKNKILETDNIPPSHDKAYLEAVEAFSRLTYESIYVIDYLNQSFDYVSDNPLFLCGYKAEQVKKLGYNFYFNNVKKEDIELLIKINEEGFKFFENILIEDRKLYSISYDFNLINRNKSLVLVNHRLTPLFLSNEGKIWKAVCIVSLSSNENSGNVKITKQGSDNVWDFNINREKWTLRKKVKLSNRQLEILRFSAQGLTINEISEKLFISPDTVKFHKKKLFTELEVSNITEALLYAVYNKLL